MPTLRRDAARNRERILAAARELAAEGEALQLNAVARRADVGIGTVYRHFGSPEALSEGLVEHHFGELIIEAQQAGQSPTADGLRAFLTTVAHTFAADPSFAAACVSPTPVREETRALRAELIGSFASLVQRTNDHLRPGLDALDLMILACGLSYSIGLRPEKASVYLQTWLNEVLQPETPAG